MTSKLDHVLDFYKAQLHDTGMVSSPDGFMSYMDGETAKPVTMAGKRLVVITKKMLEEDLWEERVAFHPLSEQFNATLSPILNHLKGCITATLTHRYSVSVLALLELAADPSRHKGLGAKASTLLKELGDVDEKTVSAASTLIRKISDAPETRIVNILMRPGDEEKVLRTTVITHPLVTAIEEALENDDPVILGTKVRKMDLKPLAVVFRKVVGSKIVATSSDRTAPYYESLLKGWLEAAEGLNALVDLYGKKVPVMKTLSFALEWSEVMQDFAKFADTHSIVAPPLPGNRPVSDEVASSKIGRKAFNEDRITLDEVKAPRRDREERTRPSDRGDKSSISVSDFVSGRSRRDDRDDRSPRRERSRDRDSGGRMSVQDFIGNGGGRRRSSGRNW